MQRIIQVTMNKLHSPKEVDKFLEIYSCIKLNQEDIQNMSTPINNEIKSIIKKIIPNKQIQDKVGTNDQCSSVAQSCPTLCDPMNCSTPGLPVHHQLPEFTQTQVHRISDAIQPSHPLSSPSPPAPNPSQHQSLFQ